MLVEKNKFLCDHMAGQCFNIIKKAREQGAITIDGSWDYPDYGYMCRGPKKRLLGNYNVRINDMHFTVHIYNFVDSICINGVKFEFDEKTNNTIFLESTIRGYFQTKDNLEAEREKQQKQIYDEIRAAKKEQQIIASQRIINRMRQTL